MNIENLSKRLETVSRYIIKDSKFADIGSDHAYLPCYAIKKGIAKAAIAGEIVDGPYQTALQQVKEAKLEKHISVRKGDGLEVIEANEVDCITIAGMGGGLITSILEKGSARLEGVKQLILQPNIGAHHIRHWCVKNNWELVAEVILEEDEKIYEILVASKIQTNDSYKLSDANLLLGPFLMKEKNETFKKKWAEELKQWKIILEKLNEAEDPNKVSEKKEQLKKNIMLVEEVLK